MSQIQLEEQQQAPITCDRCEERPAAELIDGRGVCTDCRSSPVTSTLQALQSYPVLRELTVFSAGAAGAAAISTGMLALAVVAAIVVAIVLTVPRLPQLGDDEDGGSE